VRDVTHDRGQEAPKRPIHHRLVKSRVAHACADRQLVAVNGKPPQRRHAVDVNEVAGPRKAECHDRHKALAASEYASILAYNLGQGLDRLVNGRGRVVLKRRGLHRSSPRTRWALNQRTITADCPIFGKLRFFGLMHSFWCM
jgi:hypothetical protein